MTLRCLAGHSTPAEFELDRRRRAEALPYGPKLNRTTAGYRSATGRIARSAQIDPQLLALLIKVAALEPKHLSGVRDVMMLPL